ncbi:hypothetical protein BJY27_004545 [Streptomyces rapamycinicus]|uniref:Uncharacterized protein n=1 Tax=Streptomyces rapamycinicus TaxID=1226757 RepID=A0ABR6LML0_9ACTN|nr:hypothetical protein [Streptomyces rapamycinicus]
MLWLGGHLADHAAQGAHQGSRAAFRDRDGQLPLTADGGDLRAGEPGADHQHPAGPGPQPVDQPGGVVRGPQHEDAVQSGLQLVRPRAGAHTGGDQQPVVLHRGAIGERHPLGRHVQRGRGDAQPPPRVDRAAPGEGRLVHRHQAEQDLLGQRRTVVRLVRLVRLVTDHGERAGGALLPERLGGPQPRQGGTHDDDVALAPEPLHGAVKRHRGHPPGPPSTCRPRPPR